METNLTLKRPLAYTPKERTITTLPAFTQEEKLYQLLRTLATLSGLSATEKGFISNWLTHEMTEGDRACLRRMCQLKYPKGLEVLL